MKGIRIVLTSNLEPNGREKYWRPDGHFWLKSDGPFPLDDCLTYYAEDVGGAAIVLRTPNQYGRPWMGLHAYLVDWGDYVCSVGIPKSKGPLMIKNGFGWMSGPDGGCWYSSNRADIDALKRMGMPWILTSYRSSDIL